MTLALQIAIQVALTSGFADNATCVHDWDCASEKCDNPKAIGDGGWYLTCCDPLGTQGCVFDGGTCCTFGSEFVSCQYPPLLFPETVCGVPSTGLPDAGPNPFQCSTSSDCVSLTATTGDDYADTQCQGLFYFDAGSLGGAQAYFWTPFDAGPGWVEVNSACSTCLPSGDITQPSGNPFNQCAGCCSNSCTDGGYNTALDWNVLCCSGVGQVCLSDENCCSASNGAQTESCFLTASCNPDGGEYCNPKGEVGTCAYIDGQICTSNEQCRSGHCGDAGGVLICMFPC